jgi:hypothetical protein
MSQPELSNSDSPEFSATAAVIGMTLALAFGNLLFVPILSGDPGPDPNPIIFFAATWMGALIGQFALVSIWGVLAPQPLLVRTGIALAVGSVLAAAFGLGICLASVNRGSPPREMIAAMAGGALLLPLIVASAQVPLWSARLFFGWQVSHVRLLGSLARPSQFSLANMMMATALIACLLGLNQPAAWLLRAPPQEFWLYAGLNSLTAMLLSLLITPPAVYALLRHRSRGQGCGAIMLYAFVFASGFCAVIAMIARGIPAEAVVGIFGFIAGLALTVTLPLVVLRSYGYRLVTGNPSPEQAVRFFNESRDTSDPPKNECSHFDS